MPEEIVRTFLAIPLFLKEDAQASAYFTNSADDAGLLSGTDLIIAVPQAARKGETHTFEELFEDAGRERYPGLERGSLPCIWVEDDTKKHFLVPLWKKGQDEIRDVVRDLTDAAAGAKRSSLKSLEEDFKMRQDARNTPLDLPAGAANPVPGWFAIAGYIAGVITLLFFMGLVVGSIFNYTVPPGGRFAAVVVLAFGIALSFAFIGGDAAGKGSIPLPFSKKKPFVFSVAGGIAAFVIVLVLGYYFYASHDSGDSFTVNVRPHAEGVPQFTVGKIRLEYGANTPTNDLNSSGDAEFKDVSRQYFGKKAKVLPKIEDYEEEYQEVSLGDKPIDLTLKKKPVETKLKGRIVPILKGKTVKILVEGEDTAAVPDEYGRFEILVHRKDGERVRVSVWINNKQVYDEYQILPGPVMLSIKK
jgi:hypothetical protein